MTSLFQYLLGEKFDAAPEPVRRFHALDRELFTAGRSRITGPWNIGAAFVRYFAGLPAPAEKAETYVRFSPLSEGREYWRREFSGRRYQSVMEAAPDGRLIEHFGLFDLYFRLEATADGVAWSLDEERFLKMPLPKFTRPTIDCFETAEGENFAFDINVVFPLVGRVVRCSGALVEAPQAAPVLVYDGVCMLCDWSMRYVLANELTPSIRFVAIQSEEGRVLARENGVDPDTPESFLFIESGRAHKKSDALIALARQLRGPARLAFLARLTPRRINDFLYDRIARNRYRWFGRGDQCATPDPASRHRFVFPDVPEERGDSARSP